jgi:hypothetical protein
VKSGERRLKKGGSYLERRIDFIKKRAGAEEGELQRRDVGEVFLDGMES